MKIRLLVAAMPVVFATGAAADTPRIVEIDSSTATEALLAKPGTYLGEKFTFEDRHSGDVLVRVGVWEAGIGNFAIEDFPFTEYVLMISGRVVVTGKNGMARTYQAGDTFVIPRGWSGDWDVKERMKKQIVRIGSEKLQIQGAD